MAKQYNPRLRTNKELESDYHNCMRQLRCIESGEAPDNVADIRPTLLKMREEIYNELTRRSRAEELKILTIEH